MSTELRRVPKDWVHPSDHKTDSYVSQLAYQSPQYHKWRPLFDEDWATAARRWWRERLTFALKRFCLYPLALFGLIEADYDVTNGWSEDVHGGYPDAWNHRPRWSRGSATHYQLYETVSEGTPISPVRASIEELVEWCAKQEREVWVGTQGMTREAWQRFFARGGYSPSGIFTPKTGFQPGIVAMSQEEL